MKVSMGHSNITVEAKRNVKKVLDRGWLSYSYFQPRFEQKVASIHKAKHGVFVNSGTDALRISFQALKEVHQWSDGTNVIIPALTFAATANAVLQSGLKPVFADVDILTANIEPGQIVRVKTPSTRAVCAVHLFGLPADMPAVMQESRRLKLKVVEDSCETFGVHELSGDMSCFSFYMAHHIQAGVGGMILTNSDLYEHLSRSLMNHGRKNGTKRYQFERVGYSSRATELEAALGYAAVEEFKDDLQKRRQLAALYLDQLPGLFHVLELPVFDYRHSWMFFPLLLKDVNREKFMRYLESAGIECREAVPLINQPPFRKFYKKGSCPNAENWTENGVLLPLHPSLMEQEINYICEKVRSFFHS